MPQRELIIAIDGPSGAGKSTLSKLLAQRLGYLNIDTGAMYRAVALAASRQGVDIDDAAGLGRLAQQVQIGFRRSCSGEQVLLDGEDVSAAIRTPEISMLTSRVAACAAVRQAMVDLQRQMGEQGGVVLEGRDIGSVVFPDAEVKFFLSATAQERGRRRFAELCGQGLAVDLEQTLAEVEARDAADSGREHAPLVQPADAVVIDATSLDIAQVLQRLLSVALARRRELGLDSLPESAG
ncbi:MAG: (d)CMP kinase [Trichloromonadaceae bacterium]